MKKHIAFSALLAFIFLTAFSSNFDVKLGMDYDFLNQFAKIDIGLNGEFENLELGGDMYFSNDGKYYERTHDKYYFGFYYDLQSGYLGLKLNDLSIRGGRLALKDAINSPYSLFLSGSGISAPSVYIHYKGDIFEYKTQWILLTKHIEGGNEFPDRGANYNFVSLRFGNFRIGFQQSVVYVGRQFDFEYFLNPIPNFFIQYKLHENKPFIQGTDDNTIMGFFTDYKDNNMYLYAQILVDDFCMNRFYGGYQNPDKLAWSLGGKISTTFGTFGLYHAGATKYTFEPRVPHSGYVLFPNTIVTLNYPATRTLLPEENYLGYKYGENTLSFLLTYEKKFHGVNLTGSVEYVLSGSKSYNNPWQELTDFPPYTHLLDESPIEKTFKISLVASKRFWDGVVISIGVKYTNIQNKLQPFMPEDGDGYVLKPSEENEQNMKLYLGISWTFDIFKLFK